METLNFRKRKHEKNEELKMHSDVINFQYGKSFETMLNPNPAYQFYP